MSATGVRYASITARAQAVQGGRVPVAFRDGTLRSKTTATSATDFSAVVQVAFADRSESYPATVQLLHTPNGWQVAQVQTPDLSVDEGTKPLTGPPIPLAGETAARTFALAYTRYRAGDSRVPAGMTTAAATALRDDQDGLFGITAGHRRVAVTGVAFGPLQGNEFAATATVRFDGRTLRMSFLMLEVAGRWECDAFL